MSDNCTHRLGRRRPFLALASVLCCCSMLLLGFATTIANSVEWIFGFVSPSNSDVSESTSLHSNSLTFVLKACHSPPPNAQATASTLTIFLAVLSIFGIDFTVNAISALNRSLLYDLLPRTPASQENANAWAARQAGVGALLGFLFGNLNLTHSIPFKWLQIFNPDEEGSSKVAGSEAQLRCLSVTVVLILLSTQAVVAFVAREVPLSEEASSTFRSSRFPASGNSSFLLKIVSLLPDAVRSINRSLSELLITAKSLPPSILGLFSIQFFAWIGWFPVLFYSSSWVAEIYLASHPNSTELDSTRAGSRAMFYHSVVSFAGSIIIPFLIKHDHPNSSFNTSTCHHWWRSFNITYFWTTSHFLFAFSMFLTYPAVKASPPSITLAFLITSLTGLAWVATHFVPYSLLAVLIESHHPITTSISNIELGSRADGETEGLLSNEEEESQPHESNQSKDQAGTILGLHNVSIVLPQFVVTILSSIIFWILEPGREVIPTEPLQEPAAESTGVRSDGIGVVFRVGGIFALIAGVLTLRWARKFERELAGRA